MSKFSFLYFAILLSTVGFAQNPSYIYLQVEDNEEKERQLIWQDNFEGKEIDTTKWTKIPPNNADWGNYMTDDQRCYELKDGKLYLKGIQNTDTIADKRPYLTGGIYTKGKFAFQYGKIEIRAKLESAKGPGPLSGCSQKKRNTVIIPEMAK